MFDIPMKETSREEIFRHTVNLTPEQTIQFARVKEVLGGYSNQEILAILVDMAIKKYDDGRNPDGFFLPDRLRRNDRDFAPIVFDTSGEGEIVEREVNDVNQGRAKKVKGY